MFKKLLFLVFLAMLSAAPQVRAEQQEVIRSFDEVVHLHKDCSLDVLETIEMDFGSIERHGIYRMIPIRYRRNDNDYSVELKVDSVTDESGNAYNREISNQDHDLNIRIGDVDKVITGRHIYKIHYTVRRAVNFFDNKPEIYWNVTGNEWAFPIESATASFFPPEGVSTDNINVACFRGSLGSTDPAESKIFADHIEFEAQSLEPAQGLTFVVGLPQGSVLKPSVIQELVWFLRDWWGLFVIPSATFLVMYYLWLGTGRDDESMKAISVEWNPPKGMSPAEVGTVVDEVCDNKDVVATLIDLAVRGYYTIRQIPKVDLLFFSNTDYEFKKPNPPKDMSELKDYERTFLTSLFSQGSSDVATLSGLKNHFYISLPSIREEIYEGLEHRGYFKENPDKVRNGYRFMVPLFFFAGFFAWVMSNQIAVGLGFFVAAMIVFSMSYIMPARTRAGVKATAECLAFKRFVSMAEKERIEVLAKEDPTIFGRLLPFAMVLGVGDRWADKFRDLITEPPDWYQYGPGYTPGEFFDTGYFVQSLGQTMSVADQTFASRPASDYSSAGSGNSGFSSGGGFSGGGFGGGGGGSW
ncbi:MAG: DUF2207 domain-containing protein [Candidatus Obscuribacterales bacterium]|nr:DUF2207 domain-containing protein [Candidatus Obscuribacterales bacterium]